MPPVQDPSVKRPFPDPAHLTDREFAAYVEHRLITTPNGIPVKWQEELLRRFDKLLDKE
jgi:hypothetical protein